MAYLASHGERLDMALRVARDNFQRQRNLPLSASRVIAGVHGLLRTFAYEAIAEQSVLSGRVPDAISLLFGTNGTEPQYPHGTAYILVACYIRAFGKLGRLDLSADVFDTYSRLHEGNAFVSNSYLFALGHAGHRMDAVALVRRLENAQKVGAPVIDGVTYSALGKILLEGLSSSATNDLCDPAQAVPVDTVVEMLGHMEAYLDGVGEQLPKCFVSDKAPRAVDVQNQAYQNRSLSRKSNREMEGASSKDTIPGIIAQIRKKLSVRQNGQ
ncbi:hypothetical protein FVE85_4347 [Porphyridium purpureum]|uniref:Pentatricopeptide repeat-containing protein n=1 Tax=Porphyridium purpureum TaxID=35688 RepID=A0A5J4YGS8_PORPP|nr:hypothetical protein FVE85_4347 [Porphyridium purpureum]|eukprot:POR3258..scf270_19